MPRYRMPSGVIVNTEIDGAARILGAVPIGENDTFGVVAPQPVDLLTCLDRGLQAYLAAERQFHDDVRAWLDAESEYRRFGGKVCLQQSAAAGDEPTSNDGASVNGNPPSASVLTTGDLSSSPDTNAHPSATIRQRSGKKPPAGTPAGDS